MRLLSGKIFREETLPEVRLALVDISSEVKLKKNLVTDGAHASSKSTSSVIITRGTTGMGSIIDDSSSRDAEIAKASLLDTVPSTQVERPKAEGSMSSLALPMIKLPNRVKQAIVEPRRLASISELDLSAWLLEARSRPLLDLVQGARKTMNTSAWTAAIYEQKWIRVTERIEELKAQNKWSLRQLPKEKTAPRRKAHWDFMLDEMKWLRTDFREERKWKITLARKTIYMVLDWHNCKDKTTLVINPQPIRFLSDPDVQMKDTPANYEPPTPPSGSDDPVEESLEPRRTETVEPRLQFQRPDSVMVHSPPLSAVDDTVHVFEMPCDEVYAYLSDSFGRESPSLLMDMPIYGPPIPQDELYADPLDSVPLVNVSKYTQSEVNVFTGRKRSRFECEDGSGPIKVDPEHPTTSQHSRRKSTQFDFKIRPPFVPSNIDRRAADRKDHQIAWTSEADDMLLSLLVEYQYNWDFVSQAMTPSNPVCAIADRKSPWDCFERWVQIDPRSNDVNFTGAHAKSVQNRVDDMIRTSRAPDKTSAIVRRASSIQKLQSADLKRQRQVSLFDAMRKVQRKRENQPKAPQIKKAQTDNIKTPPIVPTPQHLSQMKFERDQQIARAFLESKNQQIQAMQQQRLMQQQQKGGQPPTQAQIAQIQAARQTQHRAQLAQQAAQVAAATGAVQTGANPVGQIAARPVNGVNRPSLVGQMPPRPIPATGMANSLPAGMSSQVPNPALLRIPPGQRLSQEQMNQLLQQARLQKSLTASPSPGPQNNGHPTSNGIVHKPVAASPAPLTPLPQQGTQPSLAISSVYASVSIPKAPTAGPAPSQAQAPKPITKALPGEKA